MAASLLTAATVAAATAAISVVGTVQALDSSSRPAIASLANEYLYLHGYDEGRVKKVELATAVLHSFHIKQMTTDRWRKAGEKLELYVPLCSNDLDELCDRLHGETAKHDRIPKRIVDFLLIGYEEERLKELKEAEAAKARQIELDLIKAKDQKLFEEDSKALKKTLDAHIEGLLTDTRRMMSNAVCSVTLVPYHDRELFATMFADATLSFLKDLPKEITYVTSGSLALLHPHQHPHFAVTLSVPFSARNELLAKMSEKQSKELASTISSHILADFSAKTMKTDGNSSSSSSRGSKMSAYKAAANYKAIYKPDQYIAPPLVLAIERELQAADPEHNQYHITWLGKDMIIRKRLATSLSASPSTTSTAAAAAAADASDSL